MVPQLDIDSIKTNRICVGCVEERFLKSLIQSDGIESDCDYCGRSEKTFSIEQISNVVEEAFDDHYERTNSEPDGYEWAMMSDSEIEYDWERKGELAVWAIASAAKVEEQVAEHIRAVLSERHFDHELATMNEELPFAEESHYEEKSLGAGEYADMWKNFEVGIKTKSRFFSVAGKQILDSIFIGLADAKTFSGNDVVIEIGPGMEIDSLFRARVFAGQDVELEKALNEPWKFLGTPPSNHANGGRMNARGVSVFYGALSYEAAISEVRPVVGCKVAVANFLILKRLKILDLNALTATHAKRSIFDPLALSEVQKANFLRILSEKMSRPVMPNEESTEYLSTQAVADYLAVFAQIDGIIFPSVQMGHRLNSVVLFHHAAKVADEELPAGTNFETQLYLSDDEGVHPDYVVWEITPTQPKGEQSPIPRDPLSLHSFHRFDEKVDSRQVSLRVKTSSVKVHHVKAVTFETSSWSVQRHRIEKKAITGCDCDCHRK